MAHIVEEPKNVTYNSDDTTFKSFSTELFFKLTFLGLSSPSKSYSRDANPF